MAHARKMESPAYKRAAYVVLRPLLDRLARRHLSATMLTLTALPFTNGAFDAAASDAVFEHCRDLDAVLAETVRVLRPGGYVYATYGPLWYCWGGDHFSGVGGLEYGYSHVERSGREYDEYVAAFVSAEADAQGGARYVALDLFSRLTTQQYLDAFARASLTVVDLRLEISAQAVAFRRRWPDRAAMIARRWGITPDDLVVKAKFGILRSQ